jgi:diguanylate cyclase (GGDEF)-like protein
MLRNFVSLYLFGAVLLMLFFSAYVLFKGRSSNFKVSSAMSFCASLYLFGYLLEINSTTLEQMVFWNQIQYWGIPFIPALWLMVALLDTKRIHVLRKQTLVLVLIIPILTYFFRLTNSLHHFYYRSLEMQQATQFPVLLLEKGPWYYVHGIYIWSSLIIITSVFYLEYKKGIRVDQSRLRLLLAASVIPYLGFLLVVVDFLGVGLDYTALTLPISLCLIILAIYKYDFLEIKNLARETMFENSADAMVLLDRELRVLDYNRAAQDYFSDLGVFLERDAIESILGEQHELLDIFKSDTTRDFQSMQDEQERFYEISSAVIEDAYGRSVGSLKSIRDITERKMVQEKLRILATIDALSGINNREHFVQLADSEFERAKRYDQVFSVLMMDIDYFKVINDTKGHAAGDQVIREIGRLITANFRQSDIAGRLGGEEFAVILTNTLIDDAQQVAEQFREAVMATTVVYDDSDIQLTISIGVSSFYSDAESIEAILKDADEALYASKDKGRNCTMLKRHV